MAVYQRIFFLILWVSQLNWTTILYHGLSSSGQLPWFLQSQKGIFILFFKIFILGYLVLLAFQSGNFRFGHYLLHFIIVIVKLPWARSYDQGKVEYMLKK